MIMHVKKKEYWLRWHKGCFLFLQCKININLYGGVADSDKKKTDVFIDMGGNPGIFGAMNYASMTMPQIFDHFFSQQGMHCQS